MDRQARNNSYQSFDNRQGKKPQIEELSPRQLADEIITRCERWPLPVPVDLLYISAETLGRLQREVELLQQQVDKTSQETEVLRKDNGRLQAVLEDLSSAN